MKKATVIAIVAISALVGCSGYLAYAQAKQTRLQAKCGALAMAICDASGVLFTRCHTQAGADLCMAHVRDGSLTEDNIDGALGVLTRLDTR